MVEVTETGLMRDPLASIAATEFLNARGVNVSIDDYGTGLSSSAYLRDLVAEELEIDRSFTARLTADPRTRAIVAGTIAVAHELGLGFVAEGVEDWQTFEELRRLGCDRSQGFVHAGALPPDAFRARLREVIDPRVPPDDSSVEGV